MTNEAKRSEESGSTVGLAAEPREELIRLANRIVRAGKAGKGVRLTARETRLLLSYELPCTAGG